MPAPDAIQFPQDPLQPGLNMLFKPVVFDDRIEQAREDLKTIAGERLIIVGDKEKEKALARTLETILDMLEEAKEQRQTDNINRVGGIFG